VYRLQYRRLLHLHRRRHALPRRTQRRCREEAGGV